MGKCDPGVPKAAVKCRLGAHSAEVQDIIDCSRQGCIRCQVYFEALENCMPKSSLVATQVVYYSSDGEPKSPVVDNNWPYAAYLAFEDNKEVEFFTLDQHSAQLFPSIPFKLQVDEPLAGETSSVASTEAAAAWLKECSSTHILCGPTSSTLLPTRVVDVSETAIKLVQTQGRTGRYSTLSHCWGGTPILETTTHNVTDFLVSIPWDRIPKSFQDAILFTRKIGLNYVWIDSLCIIQDDTSVPSDWEKESAKMADIYRNSVVTIAAAAAGNSSEGCFTSAYHKAHRLQSMAKLARQDCSVYAQWKLGHAQLGREWPARFKLPLLRRGWVYQELLLSPRIIYFVGCELQWECSQLQDCECGTSRRDLESSQNLSGPKSNFTQVVQGTSSVQAQHSIFPRNHSVDCEICNRQEAYQSTTYDINILYTREFPYTSSLKYKDVLAKTRAQKWRELIKNYTGLRLTFESDLFPALSGIVHSWSSEPSTNYVAGLWKDSLIHDLLWYIRFPLENECAAWRAPTWSWASLLYSYFEYHHQSLTREHVRSSVIATSSIKEIHAYQAGLDPAGQIRAGYIVITCQAIPALLCTVTDPRTQKHIVYVTIEEVVYRIYPWTFAGMIFDKINSYSNMPENDSPQKSLFLLPLATLAFLAEHDFFESVQTVSLGDGPIECLIVRCTRIYGDKKVYKRVGYALLEPKTIWPETCESAPNGDWGDDDWDEAWYEDEKKRWEPGMNCRWSQYEAHRKVLDMIKTAPAQEFKII